MKREPDTYDSRVIRRNRWRAAMKSERVYLPYAAYVADILKARTLTPQQKRRVGFLLAQHEARNKRVKPAKPHYECAVTRKTYKGNSDRAREADALERAA